MFKKVLTVYISLIIFFMLVTISCGVAGGGSSNGDSIDDSWCPPYPDKFKTVGFNTRYEYMRSFNRFNGIESYRLNSDSVKYHRFSIRMSPIKEWYEYTQRVNSFSFVPLAFACSPLSPSSDETITDIEIISRTKFNSEYNAGDNLNELFEIITHYRNPNSNNYEYQRQDLNEFLASAPNVPDRMFLILKTAPESAEPIQFMIKYYQDGIDLDFYKKITKPVIITN